jgi:hypothetical protein
LNIPALLSQLERPAVGRIAFGNASIFDRWSGLLQEFAKPTCRVCRFPGYSFVLRPEALCLGCWKWAREAGVDA